MASISMLVTDVENGMINVSFSLKEEEIKRICSALKVMYETPDATDRQTYEELFRNTINSILSSTVEMEIEQEVHKARQNIQKFTGSFNA